MEWRTDFENAPRDLPVLDFILGWDGRWIRAMRWNDHEDGGFWEEMINTDSMGSGDKIEPTHWMPLPEPPQ